MKDEKLIDKFDVIGEYFESIDKIEIEDVKIFKYTRLVA